MAVVGCCKYRSDAAEESLQAVSSNDVAAVPGSTWVYAAVMRCSTAEQVLLRQSIHAEHRCRCLQEQHSVDAGCYRGQANAAEASVQAVHRSRNPVQATAAAAAPS